MAAGAAAVAAAAKMCGIRPQRGTKNIKIFQRILKSWKVTVCVENMRHAHFFGKYVKYAAIA